MKTFLKTVLFSILLLQGPNASVLVRYVTKETPTIQPTASEDSGDTFLKLRIQRDILKDNYFENLNTKAPLSNIKTKMLTHTIIQF